MNIPDYPGTDADFADQGIVPERETPDPDMKPEIINIPVNYRSCRLNLIAVSVLFVAVLAWSLWVPWVIGFMFYLFGVWVCLFLDFWTVWAKRDEDWEAAQAKLRDVCRNEVFQVERRKGTQRLEDAPAVIQPAPRLTRPLPVSGETDCPQCGSSKSVARHNSRWACHKCGFCEVVDEEREIERAAAQKKD